MKIGNREVAYSATLVVPEGSEVDLEIPISASGPPLSVIIRFEDFGEEDEPDPKPGIKTQDNGGSLAVIFIGWYEKPLGLATTEPIKICEVDNRPFYILAAAWSVSRTMKVDLHFFIDEPNS